MVSNLPVTNAGTKQTSWQADLPTTPDYGWGQWIPGHSGKVLRFLKHDGKIFMTFSASATDACYCMGMMYMSQENEDVLIYYWTKLNHPVLQTDEEKGIYGQDTILFVMANGTSHNICLYKTV